VVGVEGEVQQGDRGVGGAGGVTGSVPRHAHRSEPHTQVAARRMTTSVGWAFSSGRSGSVLESCARVVFDAFGLPPPELQAKIIGGMRVDSRGNLIALDEYHDYKVDFLWRDLKAVAETDGLMKYDSGQAAIRQLQRDRLIREAGYQVVHITWKELFERPERVIERILTAFAAASPY
jgi:hypothetical protein